MKAGFLLNTAVTLILLVMGCVPTRPANAPPPIPTHQPSITPAPGAIVTGEGKGGYLMFYKIQPR